MLVRHLVIIQIPLLKAIVTASHHINTTPMLLRPQHIIHPPLAAITVKIKKIDHIFHLIRPWPLHPRHRRNQPILIGNHRHLNVQLGPVRIRQTLHRTQPQLLRHLHRAFEIPMPLQKPLHVPRLRDLKTPHLDLFHHPRQHPMLVPRITRHHHPLPRRCIPQQIPQNSVHLRIHQHTMRLPLNRCLAVIISRNDRIRRLHQHITRYLLIPQCAQRIRHDPRRFAINLRSFFCRRLTQISHKR